jgi:hypothetical protein
MRLLSGKTRRSNATSQPQLDAFDVDMPPPTNAAITERQPFASQAGTSLYARSGGMVPVPPRLTMIRIWHVVITGLQHGRIR